MHDANSPRQNQAAASEEDSNASTAAPAPSSVPESSPFFDKAKKILDLASVDMDTKANAWTHYHTAKTPQELATRLTGLNLPADLHSQLVDAKQSSMPKPTHADKIVEAITRMASIPRATLDLVEKSPNLLRAFLSASKD
jgi:hypothetical protein